jgi:hypothetical protein
MSRLRIWVALCCLLASLTVAYLCYWRIARLVGSDIRPRYEVLARQEAEWKTLSWIEQLLMRLPDTIYVVLFLANAIGNKPVWQMQGIPLATALAALLIIFLRMKRESPSAGGIDVA